METVPSPKFRYSDGTDPLLPAARDNVSSGNLSGALQAYQQLIRHDRMVKEIIPDLARLVQDNPRDPNIWQTLGDALAREGDTVHARQSYDRARKLKQ